VPATAQRKDKTVRKGEAPAEAAGG
jgi:hypothetical protein